MGTGPAGDPALEHFGDAGVKPFGAASQLGGEMAGENGRQLGGAHDDYAGIIILVIGALDRTARGALGRYFHFFRRAGCCGIEPDALPFCLFVPRSL
jgi:hypothetical protein